MRRAHALLIVALGVVFLSPALAQKTDWQAFNPPGGGFAIEMPRKPQLKSEERNGRKTDTALVGIDKAEAGADLVFMVKYQERSEAPGPETQGILDNVVKAMAEGNTLLSINKDDIGDYPARAFAMQDKDKDIYQVRLVITDKYFVQAMFIGPQDNKLGKRFLDSFKVE
jgi:hypothetical protein